MRSWFSQLKGFDSKIPQHVGKGAKKIVIHHDGDEDGSVEKFEININDPAGNGEIGVIFFMEIIKGYNCEGRTVFALIICFCKVTKTMRL